MLRRFADITYKTGRRIIVTLAGITVLLVGIAMIVAPGPAFIVIPTGLAILSIEFAWARRWLKMLREKISRKSAQDFGERAERHRTR